MTSRDWLTAGVLWLCCAGAMTLPRDWIQAALAAPVSVVVVPCAKPVVLVDTGVYFAPASSPEQRFPLRGVRGPGGVRVDIEDRTTPDLRGRRVESVDAYLDRDVLIVRLRDWSATRLRVTVTQAVPCQ